MTFEDVYTAISAAGHCWRRDARGYVRNAAGQLPSMALWGSEGKPFTTLRALGLSDVVVCQLSRYEHWDSPGTHNPVPAWHAFVHACGLGDDINAPRIPIPHHAKGEPVRFI